MVTGLLGSLVTCWSQVQGLIQMPVMLVELNGKAQPVMPVELNGKAQPQDPGPRPTGHPPSNALVWVVEQDTDDIQQAGEELEGEVEQPDSQAC